MRYFIRIGSHWHLVTGEGATVTFCGQATPDGTVVVKQRDDDTPPFACSACLLAEPVPGPGHAIELDYDPMRRDR